MQVKTSEELSRIAYKDWQTADTEKNRILFIQSMEPFIIQIARGYVERYFRYFSDTDKEWLALSMVAECYQRLDYIDRTKNYKLVVCYIGLMVESRMRNHVAYHGVKKRIAKLYYLDDLKDDRKVKKNNRLPTLQLEAKKIPRDEDFFEILDLICDHFHIDEFVRNVLIDRFYKQCTLVELGRKHNCSRQYVEALLHRITYKVRNFRSKKTNELRDIYSTMR